MVKISITIPDNKVNEFKAGFLKICPIPENSEYTALQWFKTWFKRELFRYYKTGKILLAQETTKPEIDENVIED